MLDNVFISQPMKGRTSKEIMEERDEIMKFLEDSKGKDFIVLDSYPISSYIDNPHSTAERYSLQCLAKSLELLSDANLIVMCKGWEKARGCIIEHECATKYLNIPIIYM